MVMEFNEKNFEAEVLKSEEPVLVDFWAAWCGPCRSMAPVIDQLASEFQGKAKVGKLNVDENQSLATKYGIKGIPTLLFFKAGEVVDQEVGYTAKDVIEGKLNRIME
ncbi:MAG: thioredoxin [Eubacteriales bacterium]|nr:thioredoxin [Bacillota bacterium]MBV1727431.1 thioredoxin [Desulforudis sp.]MDP3051329.1 thioredoxin [Eubacteriales bacterium]MDQ7788790.1 thioredoxin [Clostridia bacterium]MBU4532905.1 thioredoxin [Bacillota bacterium]